MWTRRIESIEAGQSLDVSIQRAMEQRMGDSFGDVRVHAGPTAARACEQIDARAFTVGNHVAFNSGEYDPSSAEGQHVLAHELAHVRQQTGGAVSMLPKEDVDLEIDPDPGLEREAEETAQRVMRGGALGIQRLADTGVHVQRAANGDSMTYEGIDNLTEAVADLRETVERHDETIEEIEEAREAFEDTEFDEIDVDFEDLGEEGSAGERFLEGLLDERRAVEGGVAATLVGLATFATAGAGLPLAVSTAGAYAAPALRGATADAAVGEDGNLTEEEFAAIVKTVEQRIENSDATGEGESTDDAQPR